MEEENYKVYFCVHGQKEEEKNIHSVCKQHIGITEQNLIRSL